MKEFEEKGQAIHYVMRKIPGVDVIMNSQELREIGANVSHAALRRAVREYTEELRSRIKNGEAGAVPDMDEICAGVEEFLKKESGRSLKKVVNATGVVIHTNLGRAPLGGIVTKALADTVSGYCNLEYDIEKGMRSQRNIHVEKLLCDITGAEAAIVVNNNAAAVFLVLSCMAAGRKTVISRGELVEIGGSFRVPDIMRASGAELIETGTTNKTKPSDYIKAIEENGAEIILKVHTSNFRIEGFTESTGIAALSEIGSKYGCPVICDLGSAFMIDREMAGLHEGETVKRCLRDGADVVMFSGDKLMGSAQAGIIAGKKIYIDKMRNNSFMRMLRPDKLQLVVLEETLMYYRDPEEAVERVPVLNMFARKQEDLKVQAEKLVLRLKNVCPQLDFEAADNEDAAGGGSLPGVVLHGAAVQVSSENYSAQEIEAYLRAYKIPVIARISDGRLVLSVRTLLDGDEDIIASAFESFAEDK